MRYARAYSSFQGFLQHRRILSTKLLTQRCLKNSLILSIKMFFGRYQFVAMYSVSFVQMTKDDIGN